MNPSLSSSGIQSLLQETLDLALKQGAHEADVLYVQGTSLNLSCRNEKIEEFERSEGKDLGLRVLVGKRQAVVSTSDLSKDSLLDLVTRALSMAKLVPEDPFCGLASKEELAQSYGDFDSSDPTEDTEEILLEEALACERAALAVKGVSQSEGVEASWGKSLVTLATSTNFYGSYEDSSRSLSATMIAEKNGKMERDYAFTSAIYREDMIPANVIGHEAGERAVKRLSPRKIQSTQMPIVYDPRVGGSLLGHLASAINGATIARGTSFLKEKLNKKLFSEKIMIQDNPHIKRGLRSRGFDIEGIATHPLAVIENGVLKTWILDLRTSRQLNLKTTGHASRSPGGVPHPSVSNFFMSPGTLTPQDLIKSLPKGFYVTDLMGSSVNLVTGDYSRGAMGFMIENGEITYPVSEITIAGHLEDMFLNLTPCNDLVHRYGIDVPTLMIEGMIIAGS
ncbi:MAG: TldD/PmbA family protein [Proteobacteria bacterium]|nr:TldD/PmbA family protein [Pseudomonadota bacterium]